VVDRNCIILKHDIHSSEKPSKMVICVFCVYTVRTIYMYKIKQGPIWKHYPVWIFVLFSVLSGHIIPHTLGMFVILKLLLTLWSVWMVECLSSFGFFFLGWGYYTHKIATFEPRIQAYCQRKMIFDIGPVFMYSFCCCCFSSCI